MEKVGRMTSVISSSFWKDKRVLVTGHTGFKGSWLSLWLQALQAKVYGFSLPPSKNLSLFESAEVERGMGNTIADIRNFDLIYDAIKVFQPEIVIHMAAQAIVRTSYEDPIETFSTNVMGTVNLLEVARLNCSLKGIINVTSDKCYQNKEWIWGYRENDSMGGYDPYSSSKACSELVTDAYRQSFFREKGVNLASARAGNVIGGGDWASDRLIPDILAAFEKKEPVVIRNPSAFRPWQHVLEPLSGYLILAEKLYCGEDEFSEGWNFGPVAEDVRSVTWIVKRMSEMWGAGAASTADESCQPHEAQYLKLDISKARSRLNWRPTWNLDLALEKTIDWQKAWLKKENVRDLCFRQIEEFSAAMEID